MVIIEPHPAPFWNLSPSQLPDILKRALCFSFDDNWSWVAGGTAITVHRLRNLRHLEVNLLSRKHRTSQRMSQFAFSKIILLIGSSWNR